MTQKQLDARLTAQRTRESLLNLAEESSTGTSKRHVYLYSPVEIDAAQVYLSSLDANRIPFVVFSNPQTIVDFAMRILICLIEDTSDEEIFVLFDDCDNMFLDEQFAKFLKGVLSKSSINLCFNKYSEKYSASIADGEIMPDKNSRKRKNEGYMIPTSRFRFGFLSNIKLFKKDDFDKFNVESTCEIELHHCDIRSICKTLDLDFSIEVIWGWVANVVLDQGALKEDLGEDNYEENALRIVEWLWTNRGQIKELSIRTAQKMAECLRDGGDSDDWEDEFLENRDAA